MRCQDWGSSAGTDEIPPTTWGTDSSPIPLLPHFFSLFFYFSDFSLPIFLYYLYGLWLLSMPLVSLSLSPSLSLSLLKALFIPCNVCCSSTKWIKSRLPLAQVLNKQGTLKIYLSSPACSANDNQLTVWFSATAALNQSTTTTLAWWCNTASFQMWARLFKCFYLCVCVIVIINMDLCACICSHSLVLRTLNVVGWASLHIYSHCDKIPQEVF